MQHRGYAPKSTWRHLQFPPDATSTVPWDGSQERQPAFTDDLSKTRVDFDAFINSMDDRSFAYLCLIREYATRALQGKAAEYSGLYQAMVSQTTVEEVSSRISIIEFLTDGLRSRTFAAFEEFKNYIDEASATSDSPFRRLFVLEDMPVRYICLLGSRLRIHPTVFARHYTTGGNSTISDNINSLPSIMQTSTSDGLDYESDDEELHTPGKRRSFTLRYPVLMPHVSAKQNSDQSKCPTWLKPNARLRDQSANPRFVVSRNLETPTKYDQWDARGEISELESQVTYWYHMLPGGGWEGQSEFLPCLIQSRHSWYTRRPNAC